VTAQIPDTVILDGHEYELIGIEGEGLFSPSEYGFEPVMWHTANYAGYLLTLEIRDEELVLTKLEIKDAEDRYPDIDGCSAGHVADDDAFAIATYGGLDLRQPFTGTLRIAREFLPEHYVHQGYQSASAYAVVADLDLKAGRVVEVRDRSEEIGADSHSAKRKRHFPSLLDWIEYRHSRKLDE
jgi:hypothetical protein